MKAEGGEGPREHVGRMPSLPVLRGWIPIPGLWRDRVGWDRTCRASPGQVPEKAPGGCGRNRLREVLGDGVNLK